jgi:Dehydrogenases with different specificities (related to short-chain alcohol dehydrogenases)
MDASPATAVVTGGASGIGNAIAEGLAEAGWAVVVADRDGDRAADVAGALTERGVTARPVSVDVAQPATLGALADVLDGLPSLGALVNSAGISQLAPLDTLSVEDWQRTIDINLTGVFHVTQALLPHLSDGGSIVNIASLAGQTSTAFSSPAYSASKAGLIGFTRQAAINLAPRGIRVNAVAPGVIDTPMMDGYGPERRAALEARIPLGRMGTPADVADAVLFLCGPRSTYVTGQTIAVNGGIFM